MNERAPMTHASFDSALELKFVAETGLFEGYASVFHVTDKVNDRILPGAFRESLARFREEKRLPPLLWQHDSSVPIGAWREMHEDAHGLFVRGELFLREIALAREAHKLLKEEVVTGLSIGYRVKESHRDPESGVRVLTRVELLEVSLVTFPANDQARVFGVKRVSGDSARLLRESLRRAAAEYRAAAGACASELKGARAFSDSLKRATQEYLLAAAALKAGFDPAQPRVPQGNSDGGQWTDGGGGGSSSRSVQLPVRRPPGLGMPDEPGLGHPLSPLDFIGGGGVLRALKPVAGEIIGAAAAARNALRLRGYLNEARKIPRGVEEVGKGSNGLTSPQYESFKRFKAKNTKFKDNIEVTKFSDGSAIYSVKVPARDIPGSYRIYEKHVDVNGEMIKTNAITVGPRGELVHIKPK